MAHWRKAIAVPGWPEFAFCTASAESTLTVSIANCSSSLFVFPLFLKKERLLFCWGCHCGVCNRMLILLPQFRPAFNAIGIGYYFHVFIQLKIKQVRVAAAYI
jgi:hypothetical protein